MFINRWTLSGAALVVSAFIGIAVLAMFDSSPRAGITKANADRICKGMTKTEVDAILGQPPPFWGVALQSGGGTSSLDHRSREDGAKIYVVYYDNTVQEVIWTDSKETPAQKVRRWLHLPK